MLEWGTLGFSWYSIIKFSKNIQAIYCEWLQFANVIHFLSDSKPMSMLNSGHYTCFHPIMSSKILNKRKCVTLILSTDTQLKKLGWGPLIIGTISVTR